MVIDVSSTLLFNVGIDSFSAVITLVISVSYLQIFSNTFENQTARRLAFCLFLVLIADVCTWILDGKEGAFYRLLLYISNYWYYIMLTITVIIWTKYSYFRIYGKSMSKKAHLYFLKIPLIVFLIFIITTPWTKFCFYIDSDNVYHRGSMSLPFYAIILIYLIAMTILALQRFRKEKLIDRKNELLTISFFAIPVIIGAAFQSFFYGLSLELPCAVLSSLLIVLNKCSRSISQDSLTRLNNRRNLDRYFSNYPENRSISIIMVDINLFKQINDEYGHSAGDTALEYAADILRTACGKTSSFLSRYGGDEFVIALPSGVNEDAEKIVKDIYNGFMTLNQTNVLPYSLSASIGYAVSPTAGQGLIEECLRKADEAMYADKASFYSMDVSIDRGGAIHKK